MKGFATLTAPSIKREEGGVSTGTAIGLAKCTVAVEDSEADGGGLRVEDSDGKEDVVRNGGKGANPDGGGGTDISFSEDERLEPDARVTKRSLEGLDAADTN